MIISTAEEMNPLRRSTMEDVHVITTLGSNKMYHYLAIYDGHGGRAMVDFLQQTLHKNVEIELENQEDDDDVDILVRLERALLMTDIQGKHYGIASSGATVALCVLDDTHVYTANVGDARIVAGVVVEEEVSSSSSDDDDDENVDPKKKKLTAKRLTHDHSASDPVEQQRIVQQAGGFCWKGRVVGVLAVARSLGDYGLKQYVTAEPAVRKEEKMHHESNYLKSSSSIQFIILACDGLWDVLTDQQAVDIVSTYCKDDDNKKKKNDVAGELTRIALEKGTTDNVTVIVCWL